MLTCRGGSLWASVFVGTRGVWKMLFVLCTSRLKRASKYGCLIARAALFTVSSCWWLFRSVHMFSATRLYFMRCHYCFTRIQKNNENLTSYPQQLWGDMWQTAVDWQHLGTKKPKQNNYTRCKTQEGQVWQRPWNGSTKSKSRWSGVILTLNPSSVAQPWIVLKLLWEVLKRWKPVYHVWQYSQTSVLSLSTSWGSTGIRQTHRELSSYVAEHHHSTAISSPKASREGGEYIKCTDMLCVCV